MRVAMCFAHQDAILDQLRITTTAALATVAAISPAAATTESPGT